jgi:hypothetical protein
MVTCLHVDVLSLSYVVSMFICVMLCVCDPRVDGKFRFQVYFPVSPFVVVSPYVGGAILVKRKRVAATLVLANCCGRYAPLLLRGRRDEGCWEEYGTGGFHFPHLAVVRRIHVLNHGSIGFSAAQGN